MPKSFLVIDDDPGITDFLECCLKTCGFDADKALNTAVALSSLERKAFDGLTLGLIMPHMNGARFLRQLRTQVDLISSQRAR